jgi:hypothetical protein
MALPSSWVDPLIATLTLRYGAAFQRLYADLDPVAVKADWAKVLDGFDRAPHLLRYAVDNLPEAPPNAMQFRALACRAPTAPVAALPAPPADRPPARIAKLARRMTRPSAVPAQDCIDSIERVAHNRGGKLSEAQRHMVAHCLRVSGTSTRLSVARAGGMPAEANADDAQEIR